MTMNFAAAARMEGTTRRNEALCWIESRDVLIVRQRGRETDETYVLMYS